MSIKRITKTGLLLALSLNLALVSILSSTVSAAFIGSWVPTMKGGRVSNAAGITYSSIIEAVAKFEGTLQAYSVSEDPRLEDQVLHASNDLGKSLESFNTELKEIYPDLTKEQQEAFKDTYLSLSYYLEKLAEKANQVFLEKGRTSATFTLSQEDEIDEIFLQGWNPSK